MISWLIIMAALVVADQVSKLMVVRLLKPVGSVDIIPRVLRFTYVENEGAAFGMLSEHRWVFMVISVVAIVALLIYLWKFRPNSILACMAISMIAAGGVGNMLDRAYLGYVVDFIDFCAFPTLWMWVFNVADACVCVGGALLVLWLIISSVADYKKDKRTKRESAQDTDTAE